MGSKIVKNYIYNFFYQILTIIIPLVTTPYLSRVLGAENIGIYGYTLSIATYFILFGGLGISMYGQREIAYVKDDKEKRSKVFFELFIIRAISMLASMAIFLFTLCIRGEYGFYFMILLLEIVASMMDIGWFFQGIEDFKKTVIRNSFIKLTSLILIFVLVRTPDDLYKYFLIYVFSNLLGNISLWFYLPKYISRKLVKKLDIKKHIKPVIALFIPQIAAQVYLILDKVMIGIIIPDKSEVGYYEQAQKMTKIFLVLVTSLSTIMLSRISNLRSKGESEQIKKYMEKSIRFAMMLCIPIALGTISIARAFVPVFYGDGYDPVVMLLSILAPILIVISLSSIIGTQYLLPMNKIKAYRNSILAGACINFLLNLALIPGMKATGAAIASVFAEIIVLVIQIYSVKNEIRIIKYIQGCYKYIISALMMFVTSMTISMIFPIHNRTIGLLLQISCSIVIYGIILLVLRDEFLIEMINKLKKERRR